MHFCLFVQTTRRPTTKLVAGPGLGTMETKTATETETGTEIETGTGTGMSSITQRAVGMTTEPWPGVEGRDVARQRFTTVAL
jgi:hypothetical protein